MIIIQDEKFWMRLFLISLFLLVVCPSVNSATEIFFSTGQTFAEGYVIDFPLFRSYPIDKELNINFHVYNISTGGLLGNDTVSCISHLFNSMF